MKTLIVCIHTEDDFIRSSGMDPTFSNMLVELLSFFLKEYTNTRAEFKGQLAPLPIGNCMFPFHKKAGTDFWIYGSFYLRTVYEHTYLCIVSRSMQGKHSQMTVENTAKSYSLDIAQNGVMTKFATNAIFGPRDVEDIFKIEIPYGVAE